MSKPLSQVSRAILLLTLLAGCSPSLSSPQVIDSAAHATEIQPTIDPTMGEVSPVIVFTLTPDTVVVSQVPTEQPTITPIPTSTATSTALETEGVVAATPTSPPPTFTPPPPPPPIESEHLWLQRPLPAAVPSWTDKTYPYGGTKGGSLRPHTGVEFVVPEGTPVLAASGGTVIAAGDDSTILFGPQTDFYGNLVVVQADRSNGAQPVFHLYGHLSEVLVAVGQQIAAGEIIGLSGSTGVADGPHLHFEVREGNNDYLSTRNPLLWLAPLPQTGIVAGRILWPDGTPVLEAPITLLRLDAPSPYIATTTYAGGEPNSDTALRENFAVDDVVPGYYQLIISDGTKRQTTELWVYAGRTNLIEIILKR